jgi:hypothetical protein
MVCTALRMATRIVASFVALAAVAGPAYAVDGVVLINQAVALNGNVTPGDAPGFPVTISVPGSYRLSSNLIVPDANTSAIQVVVSDVTIDLNGFSIVGPVSCIGFPTTCNPIGGGNGIDALAFADHIKVFNGTIRGMGANGIHLLGFAHFVDRVHAVGNGRIGILVGGAVNQSNGSDNGSDGIVSDSVTASSARGNGGNGISVSASAIHNDVDTNAQQGIFANCPAVVALNSSGVNGGGSIFTSGAGCVRANNVPAP